MDRDRKPGTQQDQDPNRLSQIEQSDLGESKVNEDFVDWLKTKGPNWLLFILLVLVVYMGVHRYREHRVKQQVEAYEALATADLPRSYEDVAEEHKNVGAVPIIAQMEAAKRYLRAVREGVTVTSLGAVQQNPNNPDPAQQQSEPLTADQREQYLSEAERLFQSALETARKRQGKDRLRSVLHEVAALDGLAATAEARGDAEAARRYYEQAVEAAGDDYPHLARQASNRAANIDQAVQVAALPSPDVTGGSALRSSFQSDRNAGDPSLRQYPSLQQIIRGGDAPSRGAGPGPTPMQAPGF